MDLDFKGVTVLSSQALREYLKKPCWKRGHWFLAEVLGPHVAVAFDLSIALEYIYLISANMIKNDSTTTARTQKRPYFRKCFYYQ